MSEVRPEYDDEIDLLEILETLWGGKWKIIGTILIAAVIGIAFILVKPNSYKVSTPIQSGNPSVFIDFIPVNEVLKANGILLSEENTNGYLIDASTIFQLFVSEFNDYEEMITILQDNAFVKKSLIGLDETDRQKKLTEYAKLFLLNEPPKDKAKWTLSFEWHNVEEGTKLIQDALFLTLENVKSTVFGDIEKLADTIDMKTRREIEVLQLQLKLMEANEVLRTDKRIQYLIEQSAIAKELGIETNRLDGTDLAKSHSNGVSLNVISENVISDDVPFYRQGFEATDNDVPFYLRGFKAIDKEISLIKKRTKEQRILMANGYLDLKDKILSLESNLSSTQLRQSLLSMKEDDPSVWVGIDLETADSKPQKKSLLYLALSVILGGMIGAAYVLISNAFRKRKTKEAVA